MLALGFANSLTCSSFNSGCTNRIDESRSIPGWGTAPCSLFDGAMAIVPPVVKTATLMLSWIGVAKLSVLASVPCSIINPARLLSLGVYRCG